MFSAFLGKPHHSFHHGHHPSLRAPSAPAGAKIVTEANPTVPSFERMKERIRKLLNNLELSVSSYDTAWVAMVPSPNSPTDPCFPECINWLIDNQLYDGSWGVPHHQPVSLKDTLSSTLASVVALKRWNVGEEQIHKGLQFLESNFTSATDKNLYSPIGFDIIFPYMLAYAKELTLALPLKEADLNDMLHERGLELERCYSHKREAYMAYVLEGLGRSFDLNLVKKYQMSNGSLLNSPSATAAVLSYHQNAGCYNYLNSLLEKFGNAVPTVYPLDLYVRLSMVDNLERLGITRHFKPEVQNVLDETYSCWMQEDDQIFKDVVTCALAFRILRTHGYDVSSDPLAEITNEKAQMNSLGTTFEDINLALEVHRASQFTYQDELALRKQNANLIEFLQEIFSNVPVPSDRLTKLTNQKVENALKFPFNAGLERMSTKRNIEQGNVYSTRVLKSSCWLSNISKKDYLKLAVEDFNACQSIHREEIESLRRWVVEMQLDKLKFARIRLENCFFAAAATMPSPEYSDVRISWAKGGVLSTMVDDFFDYTGGTIEEMMNLIKSLEKWNVDEDSSEEVQILFSAIKDYICWTEEKAFKLQSRSVASDAIDIWLDMMKGMLREAVWERDNYIPTLNEYMENGYVTFAQGPVVLQSLYVVGPKLSAEIAQSPECQKLFKLLGTHGRLLNDMHVDKREVEEGKLISLRMCTMHGGGDDISEEEVVEKIKTLIDRCTRELQRLVLQEEGSVVPRACKDVFWNMLCAVNFFYAKSDQHSKNNMLHTIEALFKEHLSLDVC